MTSETDFVRIHIDRVPFKSRNPTSGAALYDLTGIPELRDLFREATGDHEDEFIRRDAALVHLKEDEHFYSQKAVLITVNGEPHEETG